MKKSQKLATLSVMVVLAAALACVVYYPTGKVKAPPAGYAPLRDDGLAAQYLPVFDCPDEFGPILAVYYRAAVDGAGLLHVAYHPVWAGEKNETKAWGPFLSRWLYTGGLSLQRAMFGKGDVESIGFVINPADGSVTQVDYETATGYDPTSFGVRHEAVSEKGPFSLPLRFEVMSWHHLFSLEKEGRASPEGRKTGVPLRYFTPELWANYAMWKNPETILRKDRAHFEWERGAAP